MQYICQANQTSVMQALLPSHSLPPYSVRDGIIKWKHFPCYWPFVRENTSHWWFPFTMASDTELWFFLYQCLNKWLSKQSRRLWFEMPSHSLWSHCNWALVYHIISIIKFFNKHGFLTHCFGSGQETMVHIIRVVFYIIIQLAKTKWPKLGEKYVNFECEKFWPAWIIIIHVIPKHIFAKLGLWPHEQLTHWGWETYMHQWTGSSVAEVMAWHLFSIKSLRQLMLINY